MLRIFKCYDPHADNKDQVICVWAKNKYAALRKCMKIHKKLDAYDKPQEEILFTWDVEEYFVPNNCKAYVCYQKDFDQPEDVRIVYVPDEITNVETYIMDKLIEIESYEEYFRDNVNDKAVNCSFNEAFFYDEKGWIFEDTYQGLDLREDLKVKVLEENTNINQYINEVWLNNVHKFFNDNKEYRDLFIRYITTNAKPDILDDGFYFYICKKLMNTDRWNSYTDVREIDIIAD